MPDVNAHLSDLFFNHEIPGEGSFDRKALVEEAKNVLAAVRGVMTTMTINDLPTPEELADDYERRI